jgi:hypothetical protein
MSRYKLFIDDERMPPGDGEAWNIARDMSEVKAIIQGKGFPHHISFDHDMGDMEPTGYDIAHWMVDVDITVHGQFIPTDFTFKVHSANIIGARNIECLLNNYLEFRE